MLPDCGPLTGEMPTSYYGVMNVLKHWMASHRESVVDVQAGPYPERANVPVTVRGTTWYLHLLPVKAQGDPIVLKGVKQPKSVTLLGSGEKLNAQFNSGKISIRVPQKLRTDLVERREGRVEAACRRPMNRVVHAESQVTLSRKWIAWRLRFVACRINLKMSEVAHTKERNVH